MDIVSIEIGIGLLLLFVVPVIYAVTNQSRKEKKTIKKVETFCGAKAIKLTSTDIFQGLFIGLDENSKYLVTSGVPVKEEHVILYNLKDIKGCNLFKNEVPKAGQPKAKTIESVAIEILFRDKDKPKEHIVFFDDDMGIDPHISVNQASDWVTRINKNVA
tara:strand:- start:289152 stop:289631 length:480 start_codon:yes stop_codon:yes gene_type:complete